MDINVLIGIILGLAMAFVNIIKKYVPEDRANFIVPLLSFFISLALSVPVAMLFDINPQEFVQQVFMFVGPALGLYVAGDQFRKSPSTPVKTKR